MLTVNDIQTLLPNTSIWDSLPKINKPAGNYKQFPLADILNSKYSYEIKLFQFNKNTGVDIDSGDDYEKYLQVGDKNIKALAQSIVAPGDSNDTKMYKITLK